MALEEKDSLNARDGWGPGTGNIRTRMLNTRDEKATLSTLMAQSVCEMICKRMCVKGLRRNTSFCQAGPHSLPVAAHLSNGF